MAMLKGSVRTRLLHAGGPAELVGDANRVLTQLTAANMFATFAALRVREGPGGARELEYALAGHLPIFHRRAADGRRVRYPNGSLPLGIEEGERFSAGSVRVERGDVLAVFTDGLTEVQDRGGRELGVEGVARLLEGAPAGDLEAMHAAVMAGVWGHGVQMDDQSLVVVMVR
jgi:sigma-B regulation protein RsbU (phosphoserine phosphatase)